VQDASTVAAVIIEPVTGSGGVYPPPVGYLEALRRICDRHGILLIFDEVITGFGRLGACTAAEALGVAPDIMTLAKGLTNGAVPMGATLVTERVFDAFMAAPAGAPELMHGYTYSPILSPAPRASPRSTPTRRRGCSPPPGASRVPLRRRCWRWRARPMCRTCAAAGCSARFELSARPGAAGARGAEVAERCLADGVLVRAAGDTLVLSPPLVVSEAQIAETAGAMRRALRASPEARPIRPPARPAAGRAGRW
jgi:beta-alanine--pyruvate transaminase